MVFSLAFCFTSLWLIMRVSVILMKPHMAPPPQVASRRFVELWGLGLFRETLKEISDMVMGACLCLFHGSPPGIVAHLLEPLPPAILERNLGVPGCKVIAGLGWGLMSLYSGVPSKCVLA